MKPRYDMLLRLAEHLEAGCPGGHEVFDFGCFNLNKRGNATSIPPKNACGTNGCARGELPILFPDMFCFGARSSIRTVSGGGYESVARELGLSPSEDGHLFQPYGQQPPLYGGGVLDGDATREQVARNIREFVRIRQLQDQGNGE